MPHRSETGAQGRISKGLSIVDVEWNRERALMIVGCLREAGEFDVFVDQFDAAMTRAAIEAGMSVCVVDGPRAERIKPIIDAAVAHFYMMHKMRSNWPMLGGRWKNAR